MIREEARGTEAGRHWESPVSWGVECSMRLGSRLVRRHANDLCCPKFFSSTLTTTNTNRAQSISSDRSNHVLGPPPFAAGMARVPRHRLPRPRRHNAAAHGPAAAPLQHRRRPAARHVRLGRKRAARVPHGARRRVVGDGRAQGRRARQKRRAGRGHTNGGGAARQDGSRQAGRRCGDTEQGEGGLDADKERMIPYLLLDCYLQRPSCAPTSRPSARAAAASSSAFWRGLPAPPAAPRRPAN